MRKVVTTVKKHGCTTQQMLTPTGTGDKGSVGLL